MKATDAGLEALCALPRLRRLELCFDAAPATAAGVARMEQLPALLSFFLDGAYVIKRVKLGVW